MLSEINVETILQDWSYYLAPPPASIPRSILTSGIQITNDLVTVIQGVRRSGKSTLCAQIMTHNNLPSEKCHFINFEDPRLSDNLNSKLLDQILHNRLQENAWFFFDEIQNVEDWPKWFHKQLGRPGKAHFVITGSNASLLSGKVASALTGRHITYELFPFSFREFLYAMPDRDLEDYLNLGGFPRAIRYPEPEKLLREYLTDIVERDVRRSLSLRASNVLMKLVKLVFESMGSELSLRSIGKTLGISAETVSSYLEACEEAYLIISCPYFTFSERKRLVRNKKYYPIDLGLRKSVITRTSPDKGKNLEAFVFLHLKRKYKDVYYWREKGEIDFIVYEGNQIIPIQVSWEGKKERHLVAYREFKEEFPKCEELQLVSFENIEEWLRSEMIE